MIAILPFLGVLSALAAPHADRAEEVRRRSADEPSRFEAAHSFEEALARIGRGHDTPEGRRREVPPIDAGLNGLRVDSIESKAGRSFFREQQLSDFLAGKGNFDGGLRTAVENFNAAIDRGEYKWGGAEGQPLTDSFGHALADTLNDEVILFDTQYDVPAGSAPRRVLIRIPRLGNALVMHPPKGWLLLNDRPLHKLNLSREEIARAIISGQVTFCGNPEVALADLKELLVTTMGDDRSEARIAAIDTLNLEMKLEGGERYELQIKYSN